MVVCCALAATKPARAVAPEVLRSVVSVLPTWPGRGEGGAPALPAGQEPEGTAVAVAPGGYLATALHDIAPAESLAVRLSDGRLRAGATSSSSSTGWRSALQVPR